MKRILFLSMALATSFACTQTPFVGSQVRVSFDASSTNQNETSAAASPDGQSIVTGFNDYRTDGTIKASFGVSSNGGASWQHVIIRPPVANQTSVEGDPMAFTDPRTGTVFAGAIAFGANGGVYLARKNPGSNTFQPSVMCRINGSTDKEWGCAGPLPGNPNSTRLYIAFNQGVIRSDDLGATWTAPISLGSGLGFLPRVGPNGEVYVTFWDGNLGIRFRRSLDGGVTWSSAINAATRLATWGVQNYGIPGVFRDPPIHSMAVNPVNGTITIVYFDQTNVVSGQRCLDMYLTKSTNQGTTWSTPVRLFRPLNQVSDTIFPWVEYTKDGRLHLFAFDTAYNLNQTDGLTNGLYDQNYWYSDDDAVSFSSAFRLNPSSWNSANSNAFMGDYQGIAISNKTAWPSYPDTRPGTSKVYINRIWNPIEVPDAFTLVRGTLIGGNLASLFKQDGSTLTVQRGLVLNNQEAPVQIETTYNNVDPSVPTAMSANVWARVNSTGIQQRIHAFNFSTNAWDLVDSRAATGTFSNALALIPNVGQHISGGTVRLRTSFIAVGPTTTSNWQAIVDQNVLLANP